MNVTVLNPHNENSDKANVVPVFHSLNSMERTSVQISLLRSILGSTRDFICQQQQLGVENVIPPEVQDAASKTSCLVLSQLNNIVDDMSRWSSEDSGQASSLDSLLAAEVRRSDSEASKAKAEESLFRLMMTPFTQQRGTILKRKDGNYVAINMDQTLTAVAASPQEAINKFNLQFAEVKNTSPKNKIPRAKPKTRPKTS